MAQPVDYFSQSQEHILLNPRLSEEKQNLIRKAIQSQDKIKNHFWLMSSGTESAQAGRQKMIALSREAILTAAESIVKTFMLEKDDVCLKSLPAFHIGGLSLYARAHVCGLKIVEAQNPGAWDAKSFLETIIKEKITVASLVPTQVFDLLQLNTPAPEHVRWIFVGGGALAPHLLAQARELKWPLILTYGMTETSAMLAHSVDLFHGAEKFPHITDWRSEADGRLSFKSNSLLTIYMFIDDSGNFELLDPKVDGWYRSDDCGEIKNNHLFLKGRQSELVKINGETVSLFEMQNEWEAFTGRTKEGVIVAIPHERKGFELVLASTSGNEAKQVENFNEIVLPYQRINQIVLVPEIPATALGKVLRGALTEKVQALISKSSRLQ